MVMSSSPTSKGTVTEDSRALTDESFSLTFSRFFIVQTCPHSVLCDEKRKIRHQPWLYNVIGKKKISFSYSDFILNASSSLLCYASFTHRSLFLSRSLFFSSPSSRHSSSIDHGEGKAKKKTRKRVATGEMKRETRLLRLPINKQVNRRTHVCTFCQLTDVRSLAIICQFRLVVIDTGARAIDFYASPCLFLVRLLFLAYSLSLSLRTALSRVLATLVYFHFPHASHSIDQHFYAAHERQLVIS